MGSGGVMGEDVTARGAAPATPARTCRAAACERIWQVGWVRAAAASAAASSAAASAAERSSDGGKLCARGGKLMRQERLAVARDGPRLQQRLLLCRQSGLSHAVVEVVGAHLIRLKQETQQQPAQITHVAGKGRATGHVVVIDAVRGCERAQALIRVPTPDEKLLERAAAHAPDAPRAAPPTPPPAAAAALAASLAAAAAPAAPSTALAAALPLRLLRRPLRPLRRLLRLPSTAASSAAAAAASASASAASSTSPSQPTWKRNMPAASAGGCIGGCIGGGCCCCCVLLAAAAEKVAVLLLASDEPAPPPLLLLLLHHHHHHHHHPRGAEGGRAYRRRRDRGRSSACTRSACTARWTDSLRRGRSPVREGSGWRVRADRRSRAPPTPSWRAF